MTDPGVLDALPPHDRLVLLLADGVGIATAARACGMHSLDAIRAVKPYGWPNPLALAASAATIRSALPGGDPVPPRTKHAPVPIEPDVEAAMTAGAAAVREARASVALDRGDHDGHTIYLPVDEREHQAQPAPTVTADDDQHEHVYDDVDVDPGICPAAGCYFGRDAMAGHGLDAAAPPGERLPDRDAVDQALVDDTTEVLQLVERIVGTGSTQRPLGVLTVDQRQRAVALREATDITLGLAPVLADLLVVADYIVTGTQPAIVISGRVTAGGDR